MDAMHAPLLAGLIGSGSVDLFLSHHRMGCRCIVRQHRLYVPSALDCLLSQLEPLLLQDPAWRRPLYGAWGEGSQRLAATDQAEKLLTNLPMQLRALTVAQFVDGLRPVEARLTDLKPDDRFQKPPHSTLEVEQPEDGNTETRSLLLKTWDRTTGIAPPCE